MRWYEVMLAVWLGWLMFGVMIGLVYYTPLIPVMLGCWAVSILLCGVVGVFALLCWWSEGYTDWM